MALRKEDPGGIPLPSDMSGALSAIIEQQAGAQTARARTGGYAGPVYMGPERVTRSMVFGGQKTGEGRGAPRYKTEVVGGGWVSGDEAAVEYNSWSLKRRRDFIAQAKVAGLIPADGGEVEGGRIWRELVKEASYFGASKKQKVTPWDILSGYVKSKGGPGAVWQSDPSNPDFETNVLTGVRRYVGPRFKTTTQRSVDFSNPATAAAIATRTFQDLMGRDPGKGELGAFAEALKAAEAQSPVTTITTTEHDPATGEAVGQTSTSEGGLDAAAKGYLAEQRVKGTEEYGVVQATTNYQNVLENLVWGAPELGG